MDNKKNYLGIGVILILVGFFWFFHNKLVYDGSYIMFACGAAFMFLHLMKRKTWALIIGCYMLLFGMVGILTGFTHHASSARFSSSVFLIAPGIILFILYLTKRKNGLLFPASVLFWCGIQSALNQIPIINGSFIAPHFSSICFAMIFLSHYILRRAEYLRGECVSRYKKSWSLYVGLIILVVEFMPFNLFGFVFAGIGSLIGFTILAAGVCMVIFAIKRKK